jgi:hypothetical protein
MRLFSWFEPALYLRYWTNKQVEGRLDFDLHLKTAVIAMHQIAPMADNKLASSPAETRVKSMANSILIKIESAGRARLLSFQGCRSFRIPCYCQKPTNHTISNAPYTR